MNETPGKITRYQDHTIEGYFGIDEAGVIYGRFPIVRRIGANELDRGHDACSFELRPVLAEDITDWDAVAIEEERLS